MICTSSILHMVMTRESDQNNNAEVCEMQL